MVEPVARVLVWDFDGTVADTAEAILASATHALLSAGLAAPDPDEVTSRVGLPLAELYDGLATGSDAAGIAGMMEAHRSHFELHGPQLTSVFEGIDTLLAGLRADGVRSAVATSRTRRTLDPLLGGLGIGHLFAATVTDDEVDAPKPAADMVLSVCESLDVAPQRALVIGDTTYDMQMGRSAGSATCAVTWGNHARHELLATGADHLVDDVAGLTAVVGAFLDGTGNRGAGRST